LEGSPLYDIAARPVRQRLHRDLPPTQLWGYAGQFPGPTLEVRRGQRIFVRWRSEIVGPDFLIPRAFDAHLHGTRHGEPATKTVVHVHGAVVPPESDGQPDAWFTAGFERRAAEWTQETYAYPNQQEACTLWYHDHAIGQTRLNVYAGLAGAYIIRDDEEDALGLPSGEHEIALIIQDRSFAPDGSLICRSKRRPGRRSASRSKTQAALFRALLDVRVGLRPGSHVKRGQVRDVRSVGTDIALRTRTRSMVAFVRAR
jgi:spore coat protein A